MVDLLCSDPWACNMGDVATALVTANELAKRGVPVRRVSQATAGNATIIGGGHLLGGGHHFLYEVKGPHLLNAVGVHEAQVDYRYLSEYRYLSARDEQSADRLGVPGVELVPCPSVLIEPLAWDVAMRVPRCGLLSRLGDYIVIHARPELLGFANGETGHEVIAIEPAPYTWMPWEGAGWLFPATHSPELLAAVIRQAKAVVTLSLHMSILSLAMGTPFCVPRMGNPKQTEKLERYWARAGFPEVMYDGRRPVQHALQISGRISAIRRQEQARAARHLDAIAECLQGG